MAGAPLLLGIDLGTSSAKAVLAGFDGSVSRASECAYRLAPGAGEVDTEVWWRGIVEAVVELGEDRERVQAVGICGQMHGVVLLDKKLRAVGDAVTWVDEKGTEATSHFEQLARRTSGPELPNPVISGMAGVTLSWLAEHEPSRLQDVSLAVQPKDWLGSRMTGEACGDPSDSSGTLLWDFVSDRWDASLASAAGIRRSLLTEIRNGDEARGELLPQIATELGLPAGLPVSVGLADTAASMLGNGCVAVDDAQITVGSGGQVCANLADAVPDPTGRTHLFRAALPRRWYTLGAIASAGLALDWVRNLFGLTWTEFYEEALVTASPGPELVFHPYVRGERTPFMDARLRGDWIGLSARHTRRDLLRAVLEGTVFALCDAWAATMARHKEPSRVVLGGGGTLDPRWRQLLANALGRQICVPERRGGSARGAALTAGAAAGVFPGLEAAPWQLPDGETVDPDATAPAIRASLTAYRSTQNAQRMNERT